MICGAKINPLGHPDALCGRTADYRYSADGGETWTHRCGLHAPITQFNNAVRVRVRVSANGNAGSTPARWPRFGKGMEGSTPSTGAQDTASPGRTVPGAWQPGKTGNE